MDTTGIVTGRHAPEKRMKARLLREQLTAAEALLWEKLRANRLNGLHFRSQQVIDGFIADFYCHKAGLIVEVDGAIHANQMDYDALRDRIISERGLYILRIPNERLYNDMSGVLSEIGAVAQQRIEAVIPTS